MPTTGTHLLLIATLILPVACFDASARQRSNPHVLNSKKPSIYLQYESFDGKLGRVRFQFHNNTKFSILLPQNGMYADSEDGVSFGVEPTRFTTCTCGSDGKCWGDFGDADEGTLPPPPKAEESDFGQSYVLSPGQSEAFSIPERYFVNNANPYVAFTYDWERTPNEPKHRAYFQYCDLPASIRKQIRDDASYIDGLISAKAAEFAYAENMPSPLSKIGNLIPALKDVVQLREKAIPILINHLDDTRPTTATYCCTQAGCEGGEKQIFVPVGYLALDILTSIVQAEEHILNDCTSTFQGICRERTYHFRVDEVGTYDGEKVKDRWREANNKELLKFRFPDWWIENQ